MSFLKVFSFASFIAAQIPAVFAISAPIPPNQLTRMAYIPSSTGTSYSSTALLLPIATVCPGNNTVGTPFLAVTLPTVAPSNVRESIVAATAIMPDGSSTTFASRMRKDAQRPARLMNAAASMLPDGFSALPLGDVPDDEGQLIAGVDGCQTLFLPTTTAVCSTVIALVAMPAVTVTDCNQYVTFSSETLLSRVQTSIIPIPIPAIEVTKSGSFTTRPFSRNDTYEDATTTYTLDPEEAATGMPSKRQIMISKVKPAMTDLVIVAPAAPIPVEEPAVTESMSENINTTTIMPLPAALQAKYKRENIVLAHHHQRGLHGRDSRPSSSANVDVTNGTSSLRAGLSKFNSVKLANVAQFSPPQPTKYYAAPWQEIAEGGVPTTVLGITCNGGLQPLGECTMPDTDGDAEKCECSTVTEKWSVATLTATRYGTTIVSFDGPVAVTLADGRSTTTSISFVDTISTTATFLVEQVRRTTLTTPGGTVTATATVTPSATVSLFKVNSESTTVEAAAPQDPSSILPADMEPTTIYETSYVATATITVATEDMPTDMPATPQLADGSQGIEIVDVPAVANKQKRDVKSWLLRAFEMDAGSEAEEGPEKRDEVWPSDVWLAHLSSLQGTDTVSGKDVADDEDDIVEDEVVAMVEA